jgi:hypothetical protein
MTRWISMTAGLALCAASVCADTAAFRSIADTAGKIEQDALAISKGLRSKQRDLPQIKTNIETLGVDIAALRKNVDGVDANLASLTDAQKKDWDLVKLKVQLLMIFQERKESLSGMDLEKNRTAVRDLADGIAKRAKMLQQTAQRL